MKHSYRNPGDKFLDQIIFLQQLNIRKDFYKLNNN